MPRFRQFIGLVFPLAYAFANQETPLNDYQIDTELYRLESYSIQHSNETLQRYNDQVEGYLMDYEATIDQFYELGQAAINFNLQSLFPFVDSRYFESADVTYNSMFDRYREDLLAFKDSQAQFFKYYGDLTDFAAKAQSSADSDSLTYHEAQSLNENYHEAFYTKLARVRLEQAEQKYEISQILLQNCRDSHQLFDRVINLTDTPQALQNMREQWIQFKRALKHFESRHKTIMTLRKRSDAVIRDYSSAYNYIAESIGASSGFRLLSDTQAQDFRERLLDTRSHLIDLYPVPALMRFGSILSTGKNYTEIDEQDAYKSIQVLDWLAELEAKDIHNLKISQNQLEGIIQELEESLEKPLPARTELTQQLSTLRESMDNLETRAQQLPGAQNPRISPLDDPEFADFNTLESLPSSLREVLQPTQPGDSQSDTAQLSMTQNYRQAPVETQTIPTLPNVVNMPATQAAETLKAAGYEVALTNGPSTIDRRLADRVASQFPAGGTINVEDEVMLRIYRLELPDRIIPSVAGLNAKHAESVLKSFGFRVEQAKSGTPPTKALTNTVSRQYPQAGNELPQGSVIRIFVYSNETSTQNDTSRPRAQPLGYLELPLQIAFYELDYTALRQQYRSLIRGDKVRIYAPMDGWGKTRGYSMADQIIYRANNEYDHLPLIITFKWQTDDSIGNLFSHAGSGNQPALSMNRVMGENYPETVLTAVDSEARVEVTFTTPSTIGRYLNNTQLEQLMHSYTESLLHQLRPYARRQ